MGETVNLTIRILLGLASGLALAACATVETAPPPAAASPVAAGPLCSEKADAPLFRPTINAADAIAIVGVSANGGGLWVKGADGGVRGWSLVNGQPLRASSIKPRPRWSQAVALRPSQGGVATARLVGDGRARLTTAAGDRLDIVLTRTGWAILGDDGRFDAAADALAGFTAEDGGLAVPLSHLADPYFEPGLLGYRLNGRVDLATAASPPLSAGLPAPPAVALRLLDDAGSADVLQVEAIVEDRGGCVGRVALFHNGKVVPDARIVADAREDRAGRAVRRLVYRLPALNGVNRLELTAASAQKIEGARARLEVERTTPAKPGTLHVLSVGVNQYAEPSLRLRQAVADATAVAERFRDQRRTAGLFARTRVRLLADQAAGGAEILRALDDLAASAPEDAVVIHLAGHGTNDGVFWYFLPADFGQELTIDAVKRQGVSSKALRDAIARIGAQRVVALIDACESGAFHNAFSAAKDGKYFEWAARTAGVHVLSATGGEQQAVEIEALGHGAFTYALMKGLDGEAAAAAGSVYVKPLFSYVADAASELAFSFGHDQLPAAFSYGPDVALAKAQR